MTFYSFRSPRYITESPRQFAVNRAFLDSSLVLPDGRKVHQVTAEKADLEAYCREHFGASASEILEERKAVLTARLESALEAAAPFMPFNNGGVPVPKVLEGLEATLLGIAKEGSADAKLQLGLLYCSSGQHFGHREEEGLSWLLSAYKQNHTDAPAELGTFFIRRENWPEALKYLRKGDKQGCPLSRFNLARLYLHGVPGVPQSVTKAFGLFKRASEGGYPLATVAMVALHIDGNVPAPLTSTIVELLGEAVKDGCKEAMFLLAELHELGEHAPLNLLAALELYQLSASLGFPDSQLKMGHIMNLGRRKGFPVEHDAVEARRWYTLAAGNLRNPEVQGKAHFCLGYSLAVAGDHQSAVAHFKMAAELGSEEGQKALSQALEWMAVMGVQGKQHDNDQEGI
ncbi:tetratricopeptide repeat protein [Pseudomonas aeruginosa]